ncbi:hypothetical protein JJD41_05570 [Oxynema sp. CENA135]|uniref:hypothetical protein n=1 Tax=Oxynema sp. CENA135 TaxID=984206 RepID=UPI00190D2E22|nr:hypothetical protein [Oxynema sp. CENA135]MBK4729356.1 hypothetical protein [Oxynema sp. CENA135]
MAIIALRGWYIQHYEPIRELEKRPHDLRLSKNSLLKTGLRADFLDDSETVKNSPWFERYLDGETVEFYIEGSGGYAISNIDLISHEIYFTKQDVMAQLEPIVFFCSQQEYPESSDALREALQQSLEKLNRRSRLSLTLEESARSPSAPMRLSNSQMRKLRKSLLAIADVTAIAKIPGNPAHSLPSANVCIQLGYALQSKRSEHLILAIGQREGFPEELPFDLPRHQQIWFKQPSDLESPLESVLEAQLQRFNLFS